MEATDSPRLELCCCSLSADRHKLVRLMQRVCFGSIEQLVVRAGQPVWATPPRVLRDIKIGKPIGPHPMADTENFALKAEVRELLALFDRKRDIDIEILEVRHGLPCRVVIREDGES